MANVIAHFEKPTLVISHNKTLAAQLYGEFKEFFPHNAVNYFVSYYDYYQPEAYIPQRDIYIEKDASINEEIDRLRLAATSSLVSRRDVIIVASVSCIYGLGSPADYQVDDGAAAGGRADRSRRDADAAGRYSIRPQRRDRSSGASFACAATGSKSGRRTRNLRFGWSSGATRSRSCRSSTRSAARRSATQEQFFIYPAKHFVMPEERIAKAIDTIRQELDERLKQLRDAGKLLEAQRLSARTRFDIEMLMETGHCPGIENYSRPLSRPPAGLARPIRCSSFFPKIF